MGGQGEKYPSCTSLFFFKRLIVFSRLKTTVFNLLILFINLLNEINYNASHNNILKENIVNENTPNMKKNIIHKILLSLVLHWFKVQAAKSAKSVLAPYFSDNEIHIVLNGYWQRFLQHKEEIPPMPTMGSSLMLHLSGMSIGFYQELTARGKDKETTTQLFYDIAWKVYQKMGKYSWWFAGIGNRTGYNRLLKATKLFRAFPFNSPSYKWKDVKAGKNVVAFDCLKCPVAEYFETKGLSRFCTQTWCKLDYPLAELWNARLERSGSIAGGAKTCDFRWEINPDK